jgi:hypothetical protein
VGDAVGTELDVLEVDAGLVGDEVGEPVVRAAVNRGWRRGSLWRVLHDVRGSMGRSGSLTVK